MLYCKPIKLVVMEIYVRVCHLNTFRLSYRVCATELTLRVISDNVV